MERLDDTELKCSLSSWVENLFFLEPQVALKLNVSDSDATG